MHTTKVLQAADFQYWHVDANGHRAPIDFAAFCPQYHIQDRVGVIVPQLDTGVDQTGYALLALTTAFYDVLRQRHTQFFDYPHHFAFLDVTADGIATYGRRVQIAPEALGGPWGALDVWPDSNWIPTPGSVSGMLKKAFDWQINRLFWPEGFLPTAGEAAFPEYVRKIFTTRLQTVYYYNTARPSVEICVTQPVEEMVQRSLSRLPQVPGTAACPAPDTAPAAVSALPYRRRYRQVSGAEFLATMHPCFAEAA
jgi:hypothetical protein